MTIVSKVIENIQQLQSELQKISSSIQNEIVSVIIDGSIIRGNFIEDSSDIDITITTLHKKNTKICYGFINLDFSLNSA